MLTLPPQLRIYVHTGPTDMCKSFDGLSGLVRSDFQDDPLDGSPLLFLNRRRDRVKILYWDRDGPALWYKRLNRHVNHLRIPGRNLQSRPARQLHDNARVRHQSNRHEPGPHI